MSAHPPKAVTLSPELASRFALYLNRLDPGDGEGPIKDWGVFHHSLKGNGPNRGHLGPAAPWGTAGINWHSDEERELVEIFDQLSPSQRRRLAERAEAMTTEQVAVTRDYAERTQRWGYAARAAVAS